MMRNVDFPTFAGRWTPIAASTALVAGKTAAFTLDDVPVVAFRDAEGKAQALVDRCPHRSVKLSLGKVREGLLQCAFHGWTYDGTGACRAIPLNADAKTSAVRAQALGCEERGGLLWLYTGDAAAAPPLTVPEPIAEDGWYGGITTRDWGVHWSRAIQTMLDVAHIPFVHPQTIGVAFGRALGTNPNATLAHTLESHDDGGFRMEWRLETPGGAAARDAGWLAFHPPHAMSLGIPQKKPDARSLLLIWCVPLTATTSRMIVLSRRNFGRFSPIPLLYDKLTPMILAEDRRNMVTAWPSEVPPVGEEVSVPTDAPTIAFARYYARHFGNREAPSRADAAVG